MDGKRIKDYDERELRLSTSYVLQAVPSFPNLTVAENISLIPEMKGWSKADIEQKTDGAGVSRACLLKACWRIVRLSGGEQQRVGINQCHDWSA